MVWEFLNSKCHGVKKKMMNVVMVKMGFQVFVVGFAVLVPFLRLDPGFLIFRRVCVGNWVIWYQTVGGKR